VQHLPPILERKQKEKRDEERRKGGEGLSPTFKCGIEIL